MPSRWQGASRSQGLAGRAAGAGGGAPCPGPGRPCGGRRGRGAGGAGSSAGGRGGCSGRGGGSAAGRGERRQGGRQQEGGDGDGKDGWAHGIGLRVDFQLPEYASAGGRFRRCAWLRAMLSGRADQGIFDSSTRTTWRSSWWRLTEAPPSLAPLMSAIAVIAVSLPAGGSAWATGTSAEPVTDIEVVAPEKPSGRLPGLNAPCRASSFQRTSRQGSPWTGLTAARVTVPATSFGSKVTLAAPNLA